MRRRTFFQSLFGIGAVRLAPLPKVTRGVVPLSVHCPRCGRMPLPPDCYEHGMLVPPERRLGVIDVQCVGTDCGAQYKARFWVEV